MISKTLRTRFGALAAGTILALGWATAGESNESGGGDAERFARGVKAWADHCGRCHNIRDPRDFTDAQWDVIGSHMRVRANLSGEVARDIQAYLKASN